MAHRAAFRHLSRFRKDAAVIKRGQQDAVLKTLFHRNDLVEPEFSQALEQTRTIVKELPLILRLVQTQSSFVKQDPVASALNAFGQRRAKQAVQTCFSFVKRFALDSAVITRTSAVALCACQLEEEARQWFETMSAGLRSNYVLHSYMDMYVKLNKPDEVESFFRMIPGSRLDTRSFSLLIQSFASSDLPMYMRRVPVILDQMIQLRVKPNIYCLFGLLRTAATLRDIALGRRAWTLAAQIEEQRNVKVASAMMDVLGKCGCASEARELFQTIPVSQRDTVLYNTIILAHCFSAADAIWAVRYYEDMVKAQFKPTIVTVLALIRAAAVSRDGNIGERAWATAAEIGVQNSLEVKNAMIDMYGKCRLVDKATKMFHLIPVRDKNVFSYSSLIHAYAGSVDFAGSVSGLLSDMEVNNIEPNMVILLGVIRSATTAKDLKMAGHAWELAEKVGCQNSVEILTAMVDLFGKCERPVEAQQMFDRIPGLARDAAAFNALLLAHSGSPDCSSAVICLSDRMATDNIQPTIATALAIIRAGSNAKDLLLGRRGWEIAKQLNVHESVEVMTAMIGMYGKCDSVAEAIDMFNKIPPASRGLVTHNSLLLAHSYSSETAGKVPSLYDAMLQNGTTPDYVTVLVLLRAAAISCNVVLGERAIALAGEVSCTDHPYVQAAIVDMYGKSRRTESALSYFAGIKDPVEDVYTSLIGALAYRGAGALALKYFNEACFNFPLTESLAVVTLQALSHAYMINEAVSVFESLPSELVSKDRVITSMVDCYARVGQLTKAVELLDRLQKLDTTALLSVLGGCRPAVDVVLGRFVYNKVVALDPTIVSAHVLMSNLYAAARMREESMAIQKRMSDLGLKKLPGVSSHVYGGVVTPFYTHHSDHDRMEEIELKMREINDMLESDGHKPNESLVADRKCDTPQKRRESLCQHSERYALAYAVLVQPPRTDIDIVNNLRVCGDCHETTKRLSRLLNRRIFLRDSARYHLFENSHCDCCDRW